MKLNLKEHKEKFEGEKMSQKGSIKVARLGCGSLGRLYIRASCLQCALSEQQPSTIFTRSKTPQWEFLLFIDQGRKWGCEESVMPLAPWSCPFTLATRHMLDTHGLAHLIQRAPAVWELEVAPCSYARAPKEGNRGQSSLPFFPSFFFRFHSKNQKITKYSLFISK